MNKGLKHFLEEVRSASPDYYAEVRKLLILYFELQHKLAKEGRFPAIYCPEIEGSKQPLVTNLLGYQEMSALALGINTTYVDKTKILHEYRRRGVKMTPVKEVSFREAPPKEAILKGKAADLVMLPLLHHYGLNSGKYITTGFMKYVDPDADILNTGVYRHAGTKIAKTLANGDLPQVILPISIIEYVNDQHETGHSWEIS